ncbi:hypothetical protein ACI8AG_04685 [Blastococcus sp. SYSU DS0552]
MTVQSTRATSAVDQPDLDRTAVRGTALALGAAAAFAVLSVESVVRGGVEHYRDVFWLVPGVLTFAAFVQLHRLHSGRADRWEQVSYAVTQTALVVITVVSVAVGLGVDALTFLGFPLGALAWMGGLVSWGASLIRAGVLPRYAGWALILLEPGSIAAGVALAPIAGLSDHGGFSGAIAKAGALCAVAVAMRGLARDRTPATGSVRSSD